MKGLCIALLVTSVAFSSVGLAQDQDQYQYQYQYQDQQADKTGTNPINFSKDFRVYDNYTWLNFGDGSANVLTAEYRTPFAGGK